MKTEQEYIDGFWELVDKRGNCWRWLGGQTWQGYGRYYAVLDGEKYYRASRVSWHLANGPIPEGMMVLHTCDNPWCMNPEHLFLGDNDTNMADKIAKGRHRPGERHGNAKLTDADVLYIRSCDTQSMDLAREMGLNNSTIYNIRNGKTWRHLLPNYEPKPRWKPPVTTEQE